VRHATIQQLSAFLDGALTGVSRDLVTRHLAGCTSCRERHAMWRIHDEVLQRVLAWEPDERILEECSNRVELALTAERKGVPGPAFVSLLESAAGAAPSATPAPSPAAARAFPLPARAFPLPAREVRPTPPDMPSPAHETPPAQSRPAESQPAVPLLPMAATPAPAFTLEARVPAALPLEREPEALAPAPATAPPVPDPLPAPRAAASPPAQRPVHVTTLSVTRPEPDAAGTRLPAKLVRERRESVERTRRYRWVIALLAVLVAALVTSPFLPEVIQIPLPERWLPRLPRVEFVRHASAPAPAPPVAQAPAAQSAAHAPTEGQLVRRPPTHVPVTASDPVTIVPVGVRTRDSVATAATSRPAADSASEARWPLLCGVVLSEKGGPLEGARITFASPPLTAVTDTEGRFCIACPAGRHTLRVDARGHGGVARAVDIEGDIVEVRITLSPVP